MKKINIFLSILALFSFCSLVVVVVINQNVVFKLNGAETITVRVNSSFIDEGVTSEIFGNNLNKYVQIKNKVDTTKIGEYTINYYLTYMGQINMLTRTVYVVEDESDKVILTANEGVIISFTE